MILLHITDLDVIFPIKILKYILFYKAKVVKGNTMTPGLIWSIQRFVGYGLNTPPQKKKQQNFVQSLSAELFLSLGNLKDDFFLKISLFFLKENMLNSIDVEKEVISIVSENSKKFNNIETSLYY